MTTSSYLRTKLSRREISDSGLAAALLLLLLGWFTGTELLYILAIPALLLQILLPRFFYPFAIFWYALAALLSSVVSTLLLSLIFLLMVLPVGIVQRISGRDRLKIRQFKKNEKSVFTERNHSFTAEDLTKPF